jgi:acyl dehydratase
VPLGRPDDPQRGHHGLRRPVGRLHTDDESVRENTPFSGRIAHGPLIFSISQGPRTPVIDDIAVIAFLGFERTLVGPVYPGNTITARWTVSQLRRSRSCGVPEVGLACELQRCTGVRGRP